MFTPTQVVSPSELVPKLTDAPGETAQAKSALQGVGAKNFQVSNQCGGGLLGRIIQYNNVYYPRS